MDINVFGCAAFFFVPVAIFVLALAFRRSPAEHAQDTLASRNPRRWE